MQGLRPCWREAKGEKAEGEKALQATCREPLTGESRESLTMPNKTLSRLTDLLTGQAIRVRILSRQLLKKARTTQVGCWIGNRNSYLDFVTDGRHDNCPELARQTTGVCPIK